MTSITVAVWHPPSYKYLIRSPSRTISHSSPWFSLGFPPLLPSAHQQWRTKEAVNVSTLPPQREILHPSTPKLHRRRHRDLCHHQGPCQRSHAACSPVFEQGGSSRKAPMIDLSLSSNEENFIADTSRDTEFARKLFGDLNRDILGPPDDSNVIILDDSDEEKKAPDEKTAGTELVATSVVVNPAPTTSTAADDAPEGAKNDNCSTHVSFRCSCVRYLCFYFSLFRIW
jgi:hypothetical protein